MRASLADGARTINGAAKAQGAGSAKTAKDPAFQTLKYGFHGFKRKGGCPRELVKHLKSIDVWHLGISPADDYGLAALGKAFHEIPDSRCCDA
jgi:hypothetical protein